MKKLLVTIIYLLIVVAGYFSWKYYDNKNIFLPLTSQTFSPNLSLEDGLDTIMPYVKKWSDDAVLTKYMTNVTSVHGDFKVLIYEFNSLNKKKTLSITYNFNSPISESNFGGFWDPNEWRLTNKFSTQEVIWLSDTSTGAIDNLKIETFLSSEEVIARAKEEGPDNFISQNSNLETVHNIVSLDEISKDDILWIVDYAFSANGSNKLDRVFLVSFDPTTGEVVKKVVK